MSAEGKIVSHHHERNQPHQEDFDQSPPPPPPPVVPHYGTFQGIPSSPAMGFPQPAPPPGSMDPPPDYYTRGYQAVPGPFLTLKLSPFPIFGGSLFLFPMHKELQIINDVDRFDLESWVPSPRILYQLSYLARSRPYFGWIIVAVSVNDDDYGNCISGCKG